MDSRHSNVSPSLDAAYRATTYRVELPEGPVDLRVGQPAPELDRWLGQHRVQYWGFVSAANPGSRPDSAEANARRHAQLLAAVKALGLEGMPAAGIPDGPGWPAEASLFIPGLTGELGLALARRFGQIAILAGQCGQAPELLYST